MEEKEEWRNGGSECEREWKVRGNGRADKGEMEAQMNWGKSKEERWEARMDDGS